LTCVKRLGRYHNIPSNNSNNDEFSSQSHFSELASLFRDNSKKQSFDWSKPLFGHKRTSLQKVLGNANKTIEKSTKLINKITSKQLACANRAKSIPENATIRKEYIKCKKANCSHDRHGPYYYAYWKDSESKKLKKKYIGDHMPINKESNDDSTNNQVL
jgi:hypothetical protein